MNTDPAVVHNIEAIWMVVCIVGFALFVVLIYCMLEISGRGDKEVFAMLHKKEEAPEDSD